MDLKEYTLINLHKQFETSNFNECLKDNEKFISTLIDFTDNLHNAKIKTEYWKEYLEVQLVKLAFHSSTILHLFEGTPLKSNNFPKQIKFPDLSSIYVLSRAQIECYLTFYYLNVEPKNFDEGEFRYLLYDLSGLTHRQSYEAKTQESIIKLKKEKEKIELLIEKIKKNEYFLTLPPKEQNKLIKDKPAKMIGWEKLIQTSHLKTKFFLQMWKLYSNYTHSEMIGAIQMREYFKKPKELKSSLYNVLCHSNIIICITIIDLVKLFKTSEIVFNGLPIELNTKIDFYAKLGTERKIKKQHTTHG